MGMIFLKAYLATAFIFLAIDAVWLGVIAKSFFSSNIGHLMTDNVNLAVAAGFYILYAVGIVLFAVKPALEKATIKTALIYGGLFGFFCYGTYDITNYATLKDWPLKVVLVDVTWGTTLTALSAAAGYLVTKNSKIT
jgi:uncharacterized membrane protein